MFFFALKISGCCVRMLGELSGSSATTRCYERRARDVNLKNVTNSKPVELGDVSHHLP